MTTAKDFWNERAALGATAGSQDLIAKQLEHRAILAEVQLREPKRILEVGCGRGELAREILSSCPWVEQYDACDNSEGMIAEAQNAWRPRHLDYHCCELEDLPAGPYDCIITERMLINLPTYQAQCEALAVFASRLVPGGHYIMCENMVEGLTHINRTRDLLGLPMIAEPWHNLYICEAFAHETAMELVSCEQFSAAYYFLSRIVNAQMAKLASKDPDYNSRINQLALSLPAECVDPGYAQSELWVWRKA